MPETHVGIVCKECTAAGIMGLEPRKLQSFSPASQMKVCDANSHVVHSFMQSPSLAYLQGLSRRVESFIHPFRSCVYACVLAAVLDCWVNWVGHGGAGEGDGKGSGGKTKYQKGTEGG